jgi:hypothetical protein
MLALHNGVQVFGLPEQFVVPPALYACRPTYAIPPTTAGAVLSFVIPVHFKDKPEPTVSLLIDVSGVKPVRAGPKRDIGQVQEATSSATAAATSNKRIRIARPFAARQPST